jgi:uncharacterized protein
VAAAVALLDEGATVPFIARYRKEATGGLDDIQLRLLEERLRYLRELEDRRAAIIASITEQNKMTPELLDAITHAEDKTRLEDLYLPYKQKRRTKAQIAIEAGLAPLADACWPIRRAIRRKKPPIPARSLRNADGVNNPGVPDTKAALDGARQILMERFAEDANCCSRCANTCRSTAWSNRRWSRASRTKARSSPTTSIIRSRCPPSPRTGRWPDARPPRRHPRRDPAPGHRSRKTEMGCAAQSVRGPHRRPLRHQGRGRPADKWLLDTARWTWRVKSFMYIETELMGACCAKRRSWTRSRCSRAT